MARRPADTTFFCGSGVSVESGLPDGQALAIRAFEEVAAGTRVYGDTALRRVRDALQWSPSGEPALRLELMLELMSHEIPVDVLAGVYSVVLGASPTLPHYAIAISGRPIVTTNQDELIESAANNLRRGTSVLHLHGVASDPASIVTTLGRYSAGLPRRISVKLPSAVSSSHVVVMGYSGRDLDIMPLLRNAKRVTCLHFVGQHGGSPLAAEAQALAADLGPRMRVVPTTDAKGWVLDRLPAADRRVAKNAAATLAAGTVMSMSPDANAAFKAVRLVDKRLALSRVLMQVTEGASALAELRATNCSHPGDARVHMRTAEALVMVGQRSQALRSYRRAAQLANDPQQRASSLLGSGTVLASGARYLARLSMPDAGWAQVVSATQRFLIAIGAAGSGLTTSRIELYRGIVSANNVFDSSNLHSVYDSGNQTTLAANAVNKFFVAQAELFSPWHEVWIGYLCIGTTPPSVWGITPAASPLLYDTANTFIQSAKLTGQSSMPATISRAALVATDFVPYLAVQPSMS